MRKIDSLTLSADGRELAFRVISPDLTANRVTVQWYNKRLNGSATAVALGLPSEPLWWPLFDMPYDGVGQWSPGGDTLYVLQRGNSQDQVYALGLAGGNVAVTSDAADVTDFVVSGDGKTLSYATRNTREAIEQSQRAVDTQGIHFDHTVIPDGMRLTRAYRLGDRELTLHDVGEDQIEQAFVGPVRYKRLSLSAERAPPESISGLPDKPAAQSMNPIQQTLLAKGSMPSLSIGPKATIAMAIERPHTKAQPLDTLRLVANSAGRLISCKASACVGAATDLREIFANPATHEAIIVNQSDLAGRTIVYAWNPAKGRTRVVYDGQSTLSGGSSYGGSGCALSDGRLMCVEARPDMPPRLIAIDVRNGKRAVLFDPNPALSVDAFPKYQFRIWKDVHGRANGGVLVLPDNPRPKLPLVITSYHCRGFLGGGTANLASEYLLVQRGFAVMCVSNNSFAAFSADGAQASEPAIVYKVEVDSFAAIIDQLAKANVIDRSNVGVAGHSYSAIAISYAISHNNLFKVADIGDGTILDPIAYLVSATDKDAGRKDVFKSIGLPPPTKDPNHVWDAVSPALNATRITAPLLIQSPENEWLGGVQLYTSIQDAGGTVDMFVYPDAGHMLQRYPSHQYWRNRRSIDWFDFWLKDHERRTPDTAAQYDNWEKLRTSREPQ